MNLNGRDVKVIEADTNLGISGMPRPLQVSFLLLMIVVLLGDRVDDAETVEAGVTIGPLSDG